MKRLPLPLILLSITAATFTLGAQTGRPAARGAGKTFTVVEATIREMRAAM